MAKNKKLPNGDIEDRPEVVAYRVGELEKAVREGFDKHNDKLDHLINNFASKEYVEGLEKRIISLESDRKWLVRLVIGAVVFAILALVGIGVDYWNK